MTVTLLFNSVFFILHAKKRKTEKVTSAFMEEDSFTGMNTYYNTVSEMKKI